MTIHKRTSSRLLAFAICLLFISPAVGATELGAKDGDFINANDRREREDKTSKLEKKPIFSSNQGNVNHQLPKEGRHQKKTSKEKRSGEVVNTDEQRPISSLKRTGHAPVFTEREEMALKLVMKRKKVQRLDRESFWWLLGGGFVMGWSIVGFIFGSVQKFTTDSIYEKGPRNRRCRELFADYYFLNLISLISFAVGLLLGLGALVHGSDKREDRQKVEREIMSIEERYGASIDNDPKALWLLENFDKKGV